jgi:hypothetical protein
MLDQSSKKPCGTWNQRSKTYETTYICKRWNDQKVGRAKNQQAGTQKEIKVKAG